jgi:hypothetical protein
MPILGTVASFGLSPEAPTIGTATAGDASATVTYTAPTWSGKTSGSVTYTATSSPGSYTGTGSSPITVSGLSNGTSYTFTVTATTSYGVTGPASAASNSIIPAIQGQPDRAMFIGGGTFYTGASSLQTVDYVAVSTTGNATNFGNLITARLNASASGSSTRATYGGGFINGGQTASIEYFTIASAGNGTSFGNLTASKGWFSDGLSNDIYGMYYGGGNNGTLPETNQMEYITTATTGNSISFGTLSRSVFGVSAAAGNTTRGVIAGGAYNSGNNYTNIIQYFTYGTSGSTTTFGNLSLDINDLNGFSSSTRFVFGGGFGVSGVQRSQIDYVEIATTGNSTSFGNQTVGRSSSGSTSNKTRGLFAGGANSATWSPYSSIDYVTISTLGNAVNFGDMTSAREFLGATSGSHGGLA